MSDGATPPPPSHGGAPDERGPVPQQIEEPRDEEQDAVMDTAADTVVEVPAHTPSAAQPMDAWTPADVAALLPPLPSPWVQHGSSSLSALPVAAAPIPAHPSAARMDVSATTALPAVDPRDDAIRQRDERIRFLEAQLARMAATPRSTPDKFVLPDRLTVGAAWTLYCCGDSTAGVPPLMNLLGRGKVGPEHAASIFKRVTMAIRTAVEKLGGWTTASTITEDQASAMLDHPRLPAELTHGFLSLRGKLRDTALGTMRNNLNLVETRLRSAAGSGVGAAVGGAPRVATTPVESPRVDGGAAFAATLPTAAGPLPSTRLSPPNAACTLTPQSDSAAAAATDSATTTSMDLPDPGGTAAATLHNVAAAALSVDPSDRSSKARATSSQRGRKRRAAADAYADTDVEAAATTVAVAAGAVTAAGASKTVAAEAAAATADGDVNAAGAATARARRKVRRTDASHDVSSVGAAGPATVFPHCALRTIPPEVVYCRPDEERINAFLQRRGFDRRLHIVPPDGSCAVHTLAFFSGFPWDTLRWFLRTGLALLPVLSTTTEEPHPSAAAAATRFGAHYGNQLRNVIRDMDAVVRRDNWEDEVSMAWLGDLLRLPLAILNVGAVGARAEDQWTVASVSSAAASDDTVLQWHPEHPRNPAIRLAVFYNRHYCPCVLTAAPEPDAVPPCRNMEAVLSALCVNVVEATAISPDAAVPSSPTVTVRLACMRLLFALYFHIAVRKCARVDVHYLTIRCCSGVRCMM